MKQTRALMGMHVTIEVVDRNVDFERKRAQKVAGVRIELTTKGL